MRQYLMIPITYISELIAYYKDVYKYKRIKRRLFDSDLERKSESYITAIEHFNNQLMFLNEKSSKVIYARFFKRNLNSNFIGIHIIVHPSLCNKLIEIKVFGFLTYLSAIRCGIKQLKEHEKLQFKVQEALDIKNHIVEELLKEDGYSHKDVYRNIDPIKYIIETQKKKKGTF